MDMMVPDAAPKGLTDSTARLTTHYDYVSGNRDLGMKHEGVNHMGRRIENSRPGILRDKVRYSNRTKRDMISGQSILTKQQGQDDLKQTLENLEEVNKVYMLSDDQTLVIGVAADNQNLKSLQDMIEGMAESYYPKHEIIVTSDRQFLRRMERLSHQ
ncbi:YhcN/YlaJ family sporulation lipoprotein [Alkalihalophilus pseudofirmus]|nr:YhcN/YlaJ family sporulation lipoprotein [Alkalihalophilus pseudofirmus]WEG18432.1 YhcN/YlaJ family sporulation lipoprotein [Alkalihalophilus pseudofirmus]